MQSGDLPKDPGSFQHFDKLGPSQLPIRTVIRNGVLRPIRHRRAAGGT